MQEFQKLNITTGQPKVLSILSQKEGYLQKDLAVRCHVEPATMTSILKNMAEKELIYKKPESVSGNKRAYAIYLTERGHTMASKVNNITDDVENISFQGFDDSDKHLLINLLNRIQSNLENNSH
jgi:DNA-binding MarR family transcriptional regulator